MTSTGKPRRSGDDLRVTRKELFDTMGDFAEVLKKLLHERDERIEALEKLLTEESAALRKALSELQSRSLRRVS